MAMLPTLSLGVDMPGNPKVYVDTHSMKMRYSPEIFDGIWQSNHSGS